MDGKKKHKHKFKRMKISSLGIEYECLCGKGRVEWGVRLPCSYKNVIGGKNESKNFNYRPR